MTYKKFSASQIPQMLIPELILVIMPFSMKTVVGVTLTPSSEARVEASMKVKG